MRRHTPAWFDEQYDNRARIPEHPGILQYWFDESAQARERLGGVLDVPYGSDPSERLDIFPTASRGAPVPVYIHGGYWRALDKRGQTFLAPPFVDAGAMVVLPNYALCPAVRIEHIALQLVQALAWVYRHAAEYGGDPARIVVAGHSAGGHLAAMLLACDWCSVARDLPANLVRAALSISGVFDLEPLRHSPFLAHDLKLTAASARRLSPALMPAPSGRLTAVVGGDESEEFLRQNALIARVWGPTSVWVCESIPGCHHMNVLLERLKPKARRGSKPRCHLLTHGAPEGVAAALSALVAPFASVAASDRWMPQGLDQTDEATLPEADRLLPPDVRQELRRWWLAAPSNNARTPNWDVASTCMVEGDAGESAAICGDPGGTAGDQRDQRPDCGHGLAGASAAGGIGRGRTGGAGTDGRAATGAGGAECHGQLSHLDGAGDRGRADGWVRGD